VLRKAVAYWRLAALFAVFAAIFVYIAGIFSHPEQDMQESVPPQISDTQYIENNESFEPSVTIGIAKEQPIIINEARIGGDIYGMLSEYDQSPPSFNGNGEITIVVIHAHTSEMISSGAAVLEAGGILVELLRSAGIRAVHVTEEHDLQGRLGAYDRMMETVKKLSDEADGNIIAIDLHASESDSPVSFTIGVAEGVAWQENLRIAYAVSKGIESERPVLKLLPGGLGQQSGTITVNVAVGHPKGSDEDGRRLLADVSVALVSLFEENAPDHSGAFFIEYSDLFKSGCVNSYL
jgi:hypothetical protein